MDMERLSFRIRAWISLDALKQVVVAKFVLR